jgi:hypothetical protein
MTLMVQCLFFTFFEISANQRLLWALAAMLDDRSEQKVTKLDQDLVRSISAKHGSNPSSGKIGPNLAGMFLCMTCPSGVTFVPISHPTWLPRGHNSL